MNDSNLSRRRFLCNVAAAVPLTAVTLSRTAQAQDLPRVTPDDPIAQALFYTPNAEDVDPSRPQTARYEPGQRCAGCAMLLGTEGDEWRPCAMFPGKVVNANGWCTVWTARR